MAATATAPCCSRQSVKPPVEASDVDSPESSHRDAESVQSGFELAPAPGHVAGRVARQHDGLARVHQARRLDRRRSAHRHAPALDEPLGLVAAAGHAAAHHLGVEPAAPSGHSGGPRGRADRPRFTGNSQGRRARPRARAARERSEQERETRPERPVSAANKSGKHDAAPRDARNPKCARSQPALRDWRSSQPSVNAFHSSAISWKAMWLEWGPRNTCMVEPTMARCT